MINAIQKPFSRMAKYSQEVAIAIQYYSGFAIDHV